MTCVPRMLSTLNVDFCSSALQGITPSAFTGLALSPSGSNVGQATASGPYTSVSPCHPMPVMGTNILNI